MVWPEKQREIKPCFKVCLSVTIYLSVCPSVCPSILIFFRFIICSFIYYIILLSINLCAIHSIVHFVCCLCCLCLTYCSFNFFILSVCLSVGVSLVLSIVTSVVCSFILSYVSVCLSFNNSLHLSIICSHVTCVYSVYYLFYHSFVLLSAVCCSVIPQLCLLFVLSAIYCYCFFLFYLTVFN